MWLVAMFDLPVDTREAKREYVRFRKVLLELGFTMLQYSVYARYYTGEEAVEARRKRIRSELPPGGQVRLLALTDRQFSLMEVYWGKSRAVSEKPTPQLLLL